MFPYFPDTPISGHFDFSLPYSVVTIKQIETIHFEDLETSLLSFAVFVAELRYV